MKKLLLFGNAFLLSLCLANAQGWEANGAHDDFATTTEYSNGPNGEGLYWFDLTGGDTIALTRNTGSMTVAVTTAGACNYASTGGVDVGKCYPIFGVGFGNDGGTPYTIDLSGGADITLEIENTHATQMVFLSIQLEDINGNKSEIEPNVSDVTTARQWDDETSPGSDNYYRKALNGLTLAAGETKTVTIDLSSVPGAIGGLTATSYPCSLPHDCPETSYTIDPSQIKTVMFQVNFGKDDINISEGDGDPVVNTFIAGTSIQPFTGNIILHDFKIGNVTTGVNEAIIQNSLSVYPNPADDALTVSFESAAGAEVTLTDIVGNVVFNTTSVSGQNNIPINTSALTSGMYILNIATENGVVAHKVNIK